MAGNRCAAVLVGLALASAAHADALTWFSKAVYTTDPDRQIVCYRRALAEDPGFAQARHNLAGAYYRKGLVRKAIHAYEELIRDGRAYHQTFYNLACCYGRIGDADHAVKALRRALEKGFSDGKLAGRDADLACVRRTPAFAHLAAMYPGLGSGRVTRRPVSSLASTRRTVQVARARAGSPAGRGSSTGDDEARWAAEPSFEVREQ